MSEPGIKSMPPLPALVPSESKGRRVTRRIVAIVLLGVSSGLFLAAGWLHVASAIAGSPTTSAETLLAIATSQNVRHAVATKVVDQLEKDTTSSLSQTIHRQHDRMVTAIESVIANPETQTLARTDLIVIFEALKTNSSVVVDFRPLLYRFTSAMHTVDSGIPLKPTQLRHAVVTIKRHGRVLGSAESLVNFELLLAAAAVIGAVLIAALIVRRPRLRLVALGLSLGLPALVLIGGGFLITGIVHQVHFSDASSKIIATEAARRVAADASVSGVAELIVTLLVVVSFYVVDRRRRARPQATPPALT